jgi:hypothetical protein
MKFGLRKPSLKRRLSARTSPSRYIRHSLGLKVPKGFGWLTNPQKTAYNRVYNRTTFSIDDLFKSSGCSRYFSLGLFIIAAIFLWNYFGAGL